MRAAPPGRRLPSRLVRYIAFHATVAIALVVMAFFVWPPTLSATGLALAFLFALAESHPYQLRHRGRAESVVLAELPVAIAAIALPAAEVPWVAAAGAVAATPMVRFLGTHERLRVASVERHVLNAAKNVIALSPLVVLTALAGPAGLAALWAAMGVGLAIYAITTHAIVRGAINRARGSRGVPSREEIAEVLRVAAVLTAVTLPLGLVLRGEAPTWPLVLTLAVAFVVIARARMGRETVTYRMSMITAAVDDLAAAETVAELDHRLRDIVAHALVADRVEMLDERPNHPRHRDHGTARIGEDGPWVSASDPGLSAPWTRLDQELLQALLAAAAPARQRLRDLGRVEEAERFASLLLTAAGHDVANQLHAARLATETLVARGDGLPEDVRVMVLDRASAALRRGSRALSDMVALGAGGPESRCTGAEVALFARAISGNLRVVADNVVIAAPAAVVERIVENLVTNAARHHRGGRDPVEVAVAADGTDVRICVGDRGPGLDADDVELLFRPFAQLADGPRRRGSMGLGLFIARGLAESVGGSLGYADRLGGGAQFEVRLPSATDDVREGAQERVVLGPRADRHPQAPVQPRPAREVPDEDALRQ